MGYLGLGSMFFDGDVLGKLRSSCKPCSLRGDLRYEVKTLEEGKRYEIGQIDWLESGKGCLSLWTELINGAPPRDANYVAFGDVASGTGASNSSLRFVRVSDRTEVASYVSPFITPEEFARYAVAMCLWFRGQIGYCYLGWEANGPGEPFGRHVHALGYPYVLGNTDLSVMWEPRQGKRIGWYSTRQSKEDLLTDLRSALARGEYKTYDDSLVAELEQYVFYEKGGIGPSGLTSEPEGARAAHGDRVISAAGNILALKQMPKAEKIVDTSPPPRSMAWFTLRDQQAQAQSKFW